MEIRRAPKLLLAEPNAFLEEQRFIQVWLWVLVCASLLPVVGASSYGVWQQLVLGQPWGDRPMSDTALVLTTAGTLVFAVGMIALLRAVALTTRVAASGLYVRFAPFHRRQRQIVLDDVVTVEAKTYSPLREYGGWGIRCGRSGRAYNVSGNRGVLLAFRDGKTLLIGSQRAEELADAISSRLPGGPNNAAECRGGEIR